LEVAGVEMRLDLLKDIRDSAEQATQAAKQLFKALEASQADVLQAEAQLDALELAVQNAEAEYRAAWKRLAVIVGVPDLPAQALTEPSAALPDFDFEAQLQRLLAANPVLKSSQAQVGVARSQLIRERADPIPDVTVQVVAERDRVNNFSTVNTLLALPLPLFNRNQGQIFTSFHEYRRASQEVERVRLVLRDQLVASHNAYVQAKNAAEKLRDEILPKRRAAHKLVVQGYRQGEFGFLTVLNSQQILLDASMKYAATLTQARQLAVEIEGLQLTGGLNPATIGTAIQETAAGGGRRRAVQSLLEQQQSQRLNNFAPAALQ
jgi:cobalt-zinc-cadmium efflux system outer membrane protein